jgi:hypothetical protein
MARGRWVLVSPNLCGYNGLADRVALSSDLIYQINSLPSILSLKSCAATVLPDAVSLGLDRRLAPSMHISYLRTYKVTGGVGLIELSSAPKPV